MAGNNESVGRITDQIYEAILDPERWLHILCMLCSELDCEYASLIVLDRESNFPLLAETYGMPENAAKEYITYFNECAPGKKVMSQTRVGGWYIDRRNWAIREEEGNAFCRNFMRKYGQTSMMINRLVHDGRIEAGLVLHRVVGQPQFGEADILRSLPFIPHFQRAVRICTWLDILSGKADSAARVLDRVNVPLFVVDNSSHILIANGVAESLLHNTELLKIRHDRLEVSGVENSQLYGLVKLACGQCGEAVAGSMSLPGNEKDGALQLLVIPLPPHMRSGYRSFHDFALILLNGDGVQMSLNEDFLRQLYGLTRTEARLARLLMLGVTLEQAAVRMGVRMATIRTHLKAVFNKTGASRQSDVIRILAPILLLSTTPRHTRGNDTHSVNSISPSGMGGHDQTQLY